VEYGLKKFVHYDHLSEELQKAMQRIFDKAILAEQRVRDVTTQQSDDLETVNRNEWIPLPAVICDIIGMYVVYKEYTFSKHLSCCSRFDCLIPSNTLSFSLLTPTHETSYPKVI
jgi:hypothetical protein